MKIFNLEELMGEPEDVTTDSCPLAEGERLQIKIGDFK